MDPPVATTNPAVAFVAEALAAHTQFEPAHATPFVTLSYAQSLDGSLAAVRGAPTALSCSKSLAMTHGLRALHDAIAVGVDTLIADDPSLTVRHAPGASPLPVVLDSSLRTPLDCRLLTDPRCRRPVILTLGSAAPGRAGGGLDLVARAARKEALLAAGAVVIEWEGEGEGDEVGGSGGLSESASVTSHHQSSSSSIARRRRLNLRAALTALSTVTGIRSLMVEGGATVIQSFLREAAAASEDTAPAVVTSGDAGANPHLFSPDAAATLRGDGSNAADVPAAPHHHGSCGLVHVVCVTIAPVLILGEVRVPACPAVAARPVRLGRCLKLVVGDDVVVVGEVHRAGGADHKED